MLRAANHATARAAAALAILGAVAGWATPTARAYALPGGRAYEMVSPPDKNGGDIIADSQRTRVAADGDAVQFLSLAGFSDVRGTGVASEYIAERATHAAPGTNGWVTHGITPPQTSIPLDGLFGRMEPLYVGEFSDDLDAGVFFAYSPLTGAPSVGKVTNLYRRGDLRTAGAGAYELLTACPLCDGTSTPLPPLPASGNNTEPLRPILAGGALDSGHVIFESRFNLTSDAPAQPSGAQGCNLALANLRCRTRLYEWDHGTVRFTGVLPDGRAADVSVAGQGAGGSHAFASLTPHTLSDGSDGHSRIFFTQPTDATGRTSSEAAANQQIAINTATAGNLYMRVDGAQTEQLNRSERTVPDAFQRATFLDASVDGTRAFFMTAQALTDDAPAGGGSKMYMYDASKAGSQPNNLTFMTPDHEPDDASDAVAMIGASEDGHYAYMLGIGQLVRDEPLSSGRVDVFEWHDGQVAFIGAVPNDSARAELFGSGTNIVLNPKQARVTPDGRHLLFSSLDGSGLTGDDHGDCVSSSGFGCRELYVYSADTGKLSCASCLPSGAPPTTMAAVSVRENNGGSQPGTHLSRAISDDGSRVFFSSAEALVPEDTNGKSDAYEYDVASGTMHLLSSGTSPSDSWFSDASADGSDAFVVTRDQLVGWDTDNAYDLYDARVGGGFPEPPAAVSCSGDACQGVPSIAPVGPVSGSTAFRGSGSVKDKLELRHPARPRRCKRGFVRKAARGRKRCVKRKRRTPRPSRHPDDHRRGS